MREFKLTVIDPDADEDKYIPQIKPMFNLETLEGVNFERIVGQSWDFQLPEPNEHELGHSVAYQLVQLGEASKFAEFDEKNLAIHVPADTTSESDVGTY